jgi:hypothetical protein
MLLPLLNEIFGEHYKGDEKITFGVNEHYLNQQDGRGEKRITDSSFLVEGAEQTKRYHLECQSSEDSSMLVRIFEYDSQIALDEGILREQVLEVTLPKSAVLFLRSSSKTPTEMQICINTPGGSVTYSVPVLKMQDYSWQELFEKKLWFLVPFLLFNYEAKFKAYKEHPECMKELTDDLEQVVSRLEQLNMRHELDVREYAMLIDMTKKVLEHIAKDYEIVEKEVRRIMGGKVLEYESKTIWNNAKAEGVAEGKIDGKIEYILELLEGLGNIPIGLEFFIRQETDLNVLKRWHLIAARANSIEEFREKAGI